MFDDSLQSNLLLSSKTTTMLYQKTSSKAFKQASKINRLDISETVTPMRPKECDDLDVHSSVDSFDLIMKNESVFSNKHQKRVTIHLDNEKKTDIKHDLTQSLLLDFEDSVMEPGK